MKKFSVLLFIICLLFFIAAIFASSPYRELRPYRFFGRTIPEKLGLNVRNVNGRLSTYIGDNQGNGFYIDQIPVTIYDYKKCIKEGYCQTHHYKNNYANYFNSALYNEFPVSFVTWHEAQTFCRAYGGDLPDMKQWELAAGSVYRYDYAWGSDEPTISRANIDGFYQSQIPSGWLPLGASPYGILDLTGNVREWILDNNHSDDFGNGLKGGSYQDSFSIAKNETVFYHEPTSSGFNRGFRCVYPADIPEEKETILSE